MRAQISIAQKVCIAALLIVVCALAPGNGAAAPSTKDRPPDFLSFTVGDKLTYEFDDGVDRHVIVEEVVTSTIREGRHLVQICRRQVGTDAVSNHGFEVSNDGLRQTVMDGKELKHACLLLKLGARIGDEWTNAGSEDTWCVGKFAVEGEDELTVPAGKFKAIRVKNVSKFMGQTVTIVSWYSDGIGLIRQSCTIGDSNSDLCLTSFTPKRRK